MNLLIVIRVVSFRFRLFGLSVSKLVSPFEPIRDDGKMISITKKRELGKEY